MPLPYTDFEETSLGILANALGKPGTSDLAPLALSLIQGAQDRKAQNVATRQQGLSSLQQMAAQMAASGAAPLATRNLVQGQAEMLPGMRGERGEEQVGALGQFVKGLYPGGPGSVSGLAPADYRAQFEQAKPGALDEEDRAAVGSLVSSALTAGTPMLDIREQVRRAMIAAGGNERSVEAAVQEAESMYEQMIGMDLESMRGLGDTLRGVQSAGKLSDLFGDYSQDQGDFAVPFEGGGEDVDITALVGQLAGQPGRLEDLIEMTSQNPTWTQDNPGFFDRLGMLSGQFGALGA